MLSLGCCCLIDGSIPIDSVPVRLQRRRSSSPMKLSINDITDGEIWWPSNDDRWLIDTRMCSHVNSDPGLASSDPLAAV